MDFFAGPDLHLLESISHSSLIIAACNSIYSHKKEEGAILTQPTQLSSFFTVQHYCLLGAIFLYMYIFTLQYNSIFTLVTLVIKYIQVILKPDFN